MTSTIDHVLARQQELAAERQTWEHVWAEIADYVLPRRAVLGQTPRSTAGEPQGRVKGGKVFDATAIHANELLAAGLNGLLTNPAERWFTLKLAGRPDEASDAGREWLEEVERRMLAVFASPDSRFSPAIHELYLDLGAFGTAAMFVGERPGEGGAPSGILFRTFHLGEIFPSEGAFGQVDTVYRRYAWSARQMIARWGEKGVSEAVRRAGTTRPEMQFEIVHGVFPRRERDPARRDGANKPWASVHVEAAARHLLEDEGFEEFPYLVPRWAKVPGERFGRSPAWTMLPDIKMLNAMSKTVLKAAQKIVDPPLLLADDGVIQPVTTVPGGLNYGGVDPSGRQLIQPLTTGARVDIGLEMMEQRRATIRDAFFTTLMQTPQSPQRTATQVLQETEERMRMMSPVLGRLQSELLGPLVRRVFALLLRSGALPEMPGELDGRGLRVEYVSPIVRAQRAGELLGIGRTFETVAPFAQLDPTVWDVFDVEALARRAADVNGVPATILRDGEAVAALRAQRQKQMEAAAAAAQGAMAQAQGGGDGMV